MRPDEDSTESTADTRRARATGCALAVRCPGLYALWRGTEKEQGYKHRRRRGHRARTPRGASPCAADSRRRAAAAGWRTGVPGRPPIGTAARTTVFVLAFHDRLIDRCAVLYTCNQESVQPSRLCHAARASRGHRRHTKHNSRVHHRDPLRRNRRARHRTPRIENGHMGCMRPHRHEPTHASTHSAVPHGPHSLAHNAHHHWHKEVRRERRCRDLPR